MDRHINKLAMADQNKGEVMSPHELYSRSNPGLCGQGIDYTDPRSWYDSRQAKKLMRSFIRKYNSQLTKPGYSDERALAKFIVDLPQNMVDAADLTKYSAQVEMPYSKYDARTINISTPNDHENQIDSVVSATPEDSAKQLLSSERSWSEHILQIRKEDANINHLTLPMQGEMDMDEVQMFLNTTTVGNNPSHAQTVDENSAQKIGDHIHLKLERKLHIPLPPIFLPKPNTDEAIATEKKNPERSWESRKDLPSTHTDVCFLNYKQKYRGLRLPQHETNVKEVETYKETYLLRQKSLLKFKSFPEEHMCKARHGNKRKLLKKINNGKSLPGKFEQETKTRKTHRPGHCNNNTPAFLETNDDATTDNITQPWPYKKSGIKFLYKCPSDGFLNRSSSQKKRERTAVINLDLHEAENEKRKPKSQGDTAVSNSLQRFLLSRGFSTDGVAVEEHGYNLDRVQEVQQPPGESEITGKPKRGYLRKFKQIQVFGESRRPDTSHRGRIHWEDSKVGPVLPVLRPPENFKLDLNPLGDVWQSTNKDKQTRRVTTETAKVGKTTILIDAPVSGYRKWHRGQATRPLRIEVTFGRGSHGKSDNKSSTHSAAKFDVKQEPTNVENKRDDDNIVKKEARAGSSALDMDINDATKPAHSLGHMSQADRTVAAEGVRLDAELITDQDAVPAEQAPALNSES